jgi:hypothetical protein
MNHQGSQKSEESEHILVPLPQGASPIASNNSRFVSLYEIPRQEKIKVTHG